jgi:hypothetical protein
MSRETVKNYDEVIETVRNFNKGLEEGVGLENKLSYFRGWYYIPELDAVGPSKFIGYKGMTAKEYMNRNDLDGRETNEILSQWFKWFDVKDGETPENKYLADLTERLLERFDKAPNLSIWYAAPRGWKISIHKSSPPSTSNQGESTAIDNRPIVEVFWRAFLSLYPEDQDALAQRITKHSNKRQ